MWNTRSGSSLQQHKFGVETVKYSVNWFEPERCSQIQRKPSRNEREKNRIKVFDIELILRNMKNSEPKKMIEK